MGKKIAILQSNYIPWKGYFDLINMADEFIVYDAVQYTKNDWRNRNLIKTHNGVTWLTIPVRKFALTQSIAETVISNKKWGKKHWNTIIANYGKATFFGKYKKLFEKLYSTQESQLSNINLLFIKTINSILGIETKISSCFDYILLEEKVERLVNLCKQAEATTYISGPAAKKYLDISKFTQENISVEWIDYSNYREYSQMHPPFVHSVSILDLIFNVGPETNKYMKSF